MNGFAIPIKVTSRFMDDNDTKTLQTSIDNFLELIVFSPHGSFKADYYFGFVFQNTKFQNTDPSNQIDTIKINGSSVNKDNYAYQLKLAIEEYETRMKNVRVMIYYNKDKKQVSIYVTGQYDEDFTEKTYTKNITFYIW